MEEIDKMDETTTPLLMFHSEEFSKELISLINRHSMENQNDTPDWILADYIMNCLYTFTVASKKRDDWWGHKLWDKQV